MSHTRFLRLLDLDRPAPVTRLFTTLADGQRKAIFHFYYRQRSGRGWQPVGRIEWDSLPSGSAGEPTLELRLIPGRAGNLLLRLRERSSGATGNYRVRLPWRPRPETRKNAASRRTVFGLAAAAGLLAVAALVAFGFTPVRAWLATRQAAVGRRAPAAPPQSKPPADGPEKAGAVAAPIPPATPAPTARAQVTRPRGTPETRVDGESLSYRVLWGDTLWRITQRYYGNADLYDLLAGENAIADPDLLITGTELRLPPRIDDQDRK